MAEVLTVPGVEFPLEPSPPGAWQVDGGRESVTVTAGPRTDLFADPGGAEGQNAAPMLNAATLLGDPGVGDFQLTARVTPGFAATFDAGVLVVWADERHWAKLCFEYSPAGEAMVVSVVTRGVSDDANAFTVAAPHVWLRVSRIGPAYAYHASHDGTEWSMIRFFGLGEGAPGRHLAGFEAQSPTGDGCTVTFDRIRFTRTRLRDLRDGT